MSDSSPPSSATARRGPPPLPRRAGESAPQPVTVSGSAVDELAELVLAEAEAQSDKKRASDLYVRGALLVWDGLGDVARAQQILEKVDHPLAPALRLAAALEIGEPALLAACVADAQKRNDKSELADLGGLLLFRDPAQAAELLKLAGEEGALARRLALAASGRWAELVDVAMKTRDLGPDGLAEAAQAAQDHLSDDKRALELLERALAPGPLFPYVAERILELDPDRIDVYLAKLEALGGDAPVERAATQSLLAGALERAGKTDDAAALMAVLLETDEPPDFGAEVSRRAQARLAARTGKWARAAEAWERLAEMSSSVAWASACQRRAAELWGAKGNDPARAEKLWLRLHAEDPADAPSAWAILRLRIGRGSLAEAAQILEAHGRAVASGGTTLLAMAARAHEMSEGAPARSGKQPQLPQLIGRWRAAAAGGADRVALEALARAHRGSGERANLVEIYRKLGAALEPRRAAAYLSVAAVLSLDLETGTEEAERLFDSASQKEPDDLLCHAGRALLFRRRSQWADLAGALEALVALSRSRTLQGRLYRQLAQVAGERLGNVEVAHKSYEKALELQPDDVDTLHAFARLLGEAGKWSRAVELRERAAKASPQAERAAALLVEVGQIEEKQLSNDEAARNAYQRALERDPRHLPALAALAALHRRHKRTPELLDVLRREMEAADGEGPERRLELQLELAKAAEEGGELEVAVDGFRAALASDPGQAQALAGLERLCRSEGQWELLLAVFRGAPVTARTARVVCEALEQLERWSELGEAREIELGLLSEPKEIGRAAQALAELYERRLNNLDAAARAWHRVDEADPSDPQAARALQRIYEARDRYADLSAAIERELTLEDQLEPERRLELWLRLGEIRRSRLSRPDAAAEAYERALLIDPRHGDALASLAEIYAGTKRSDDLNRILDMRAQATSDPQQRAAVFQQKGDLMERSGDLDGALAAFVEAFKLDPSSRACFTAYERVCYRREKWRQAMELYDAAIQLVEEHRSRAYRLADLYARRGQLQLQYLAQPGEAAASYLRVLELDPEADTAQTALERIFSAQSDWQGLIAAYERRAELVKDDGKRVEILRRAARVAAAKLKDAPTAARLYGKLHSVDPTDAEGLDALERHYERTRDWEKIIGVLTTRLSLTAGGDEAIALYLRISQMCEEGLRDADRAIDAYRKILDIAPSHKEAIEALGRLYEGTEKWAELVEVTRRQIRIVSDRAQKAILYFKCGSVMESKFGKEDDAIRYYDAAIKTSPSCLPAVHGLRDLYLRKEEWPRVIQTLELEAKLWTEDKERAGVFAHIGQIYGDKLGDVDRAIQYYESALTVDKECLPANRALFELYFARGEFARALPIAVILTQKVTREGDPVERSEFYRKRAIVAEHTGDQRAAAESLVVALEIRPENSDALDHLVALCRAAPEAYDFTATCRELEKLYRKRNEQPSLARVMTAQGILREVMYDVDGAEEIYLQAIKLAPEEYRVMEALVGLHVTLRRFEAGAAVLDGFIARARDLPSKSAARYRLAELYGDGAMDPKRATKTLEELIAEDPEHREAHFRLSQELYLLGRYSEAHRACERLIQLAAAPGQTAPPEELARYYDYLGRIAEASGDPSAAVRAYRRATDLDPAYAPSAIALARRAAQGGDRGHAHGILDEALRAAESRGPEVELPLRRGLARFCVALDERERAIEAYRAVIARAPATAQETLDDRVALAELLAGAASTVQLAREELLSVLSLDLRHVPAYRQLMQLYQRSGDPERAARVGTMLTLLGYAEAGDRVSGFRATIKRGALSEELRRSRLLPAPLLGPLHEALAAVRETLDEIYGAPPIAGAIPVAQVSDPGFKVCVVDAQRLFGVPAEVMVAPQVPNGVMLLDQPKPTVFIDERLIPLNQPDGERRFLLGRLFEPLRGGYGILTRLRSSQRAEVGHLLEQLIKPEAERSPQTQEFVRALPRKASRAVEKLQAPPSGAPVPAVSFSAWLDTLGLAADRAGLLACDDVGAAARMLARLGGEELAVSAEGGVALGQVPGVAELIRFFLSDGYHELRSTLGDPTGRL